VLYKWSNARNKTNVERFIDTCDFPNCNDACPSPIDPISNREADALKLFSFYGILSETELAAFLKIDANDLKNYKYEDLMSRLMAKLHMVKRH
jgi:hypothetical protein